MIYSLRGKLTTKGTDFAVIECGGVGFLVYAPVTALAEMGAVGSETTLYTYMNVKDDGIDLYGFSSPRQQECFRMLITVSGVGPKSALAVLSMYEPDRIAVAIASGDYKAFCACSGIGPKIAQRLVLELKDKASAIGAADITGVSAVSQEGSPTADAVAALVQLGYSQSEAASAVAKLPSGLSTEDMIMRALRQFDKRR